MARLNLRKKLQSTRILSLDVIEDPLDVNAFLNKIIQQNARLIIRLNNSGKSFNSSLLKIDTPTLLIDALSPYEGNELIDHSNFINVNFNTVDDGTFSLSGLTHDIGKLVIDQYFHKEFNSIIDYVSNNRVTFSKAEKEILGVTHYRIAAKLLQQWYFPEKVIMQIFYHHAPWHDNNFTAGSIIVYLSNILTKISGYTCFEEEEQTQISDLINPSALDFINKNGFELDQQFSEKLIKLISEFTSAETNNVLNIFD
jgi:hypothetical protein